MLRVDAGVRDFRDLAVEFVGRRGVARMARFGVRSGSLKRSLNEVIPHNQAV